jgi:hypothetical protein
MRRAFALFLLTLPLALPAAAQDASGVRVITPRGGQAAAASGVQVITPRALPAPRPVTTRASAGAIAAARQYLCPHGGTPMRGGRCARGGGIGRAGSGLTGLMGDDPSIIGWDRDLPPPNRAQAPCPPGSRAVAARDQPHITRCLIE